MDRHTVVLVDDHPPLRAGVASIIERSGSYQVVADVGTVDEAFHVIRMYRPDVVIVDVTLPDGNGVDLIRAAKAERAESKVLILSMHAIRRIADEALRAGADGYMLKESTAEHLITALDQILSGDSFLDARLVPVLDGGTPHGARPDGRDGVEILSDREYQVFCLLAHGRTSKEIGVTLGISPKTVDNHRSSIMEKLGVLSVADLVRIAIRTGAMQP
jgi:DNA-binding NarL/FixJ family response regulator